MVVGVDEAGRGPLAGPVAACALYLKKLPAFLINSGEKYNRNCSENNSYKRWKDSKALCVFRREEAFCWIRKNAIFSVGIANQREIDKYNILEATFLAFNRAIEGLLGKAPSLKKATFVIDGSSFRTPLDLNYKCIIKADKKVAEVSCASIVAKVARDHFMKMGSFLYPRWNFSQHKGYPTREHIALIKKYRLSPLHRRTFLPCREKL